MLKQAKQAVLKVDKVIWVPVKVGVNEKLRLPFILFTDWTVKERNDFAQDLKKLLPFWQEKKIALCYSAWRAYGEGKISKSTSDAISKFFSSVAMETGGVSLPWMVATKESSIEDFGPMFADHCRYEWLKNQIGMVEVRTDFNFGGAND